MKQDKLVKWGERLLKKLDKGTWSVTDSIEFVRNAVDTLKQESMAHRGKS